VDRGRYLLGDCGVMARAIHEITGWPVVLMTEPCHALVRMPDGRLLDALGPHDPGCLDGIPHHDADAGELARFGRLASAPDVIADAKELLDMYGLDEPGEAEPLVLPFPWRPAARRVSAAEPASCGLGPASSGPI